MRNSFRSIQFSDEKSRQAVFYFYSLYLVAIRQNAPYQRNAKANEYHAADAVDDVDVVSG